MRRLDIRILACIECRDEKNLQRRGAKNSKTGKARNPKSKIEGFWKPEWKRGLADRKAFPERKAHSLAGAASIQA